MANILTTQSKAYITLLLEAEQSKLEYLIGHHPKGCEYDCPKQWQEQLEVCKLALKELAK
jgi:hypothetical protein